MFWSLPVVGLVVKDALAVLSFFGEAFLWDFGVLQEEQVTHEKSFVEIGSGYGCEFNGSELDVYLVGFLRDERDVAEVAEEVVDAFETNVFFQLETKGRGMYRLCLFYVEGGVDTVSAGLWRGGVSAA